MNEGKPKVIEEDSEGYKRAMRAAQEKSKQEKSKKEKIEAVIKLLQRPLDFSPEDAPDSDKINAALQDKIDRSVRILLSKTKEHCCKIGCIKDAEWGIYADGVPDTSACTEHIGELLTDAKEHRIFRIF